MTKAKIFLILSLSFLGGVFSASFYYPKTLGQSTILLLVALTVIIFVTNYDSSQRCSRGVLIAICIGFFTLGLFLVSNRLEKIKNLDKDGRVFSGKATVSRETSVCGQMQKIIVSPKENISGKFLINTLAYPQYFYGDELAIDCILKIPSNERLDFDYRMYLAKEGIFYECKNAKIKKIGSDKGSQVYAGIIKVKNKFEKNIYAFLPSPESGLLVGLILGGSYQLSENVRDTFSRTGLTHIVAVSGYNVTIVAEYLMLLGIFLGLWRRQAFWFSMVGIILFVIMTGLSASAVRAGVMGILLIWAMKNGRLANALNAVLFSAVVMLISNPLLLFWDTGFQLSYLATLGIIYLYPIFEARFISHQTQGWLVGLVLETLFLSLAAQIFVLPVIIYDFGRLSLISPLANVLILPLIPLTMFLGFISALLGFIWPALGIVVSWVAYLPLKYETETIRYLASFRYSSVETTVPLLAVVSWYVILAAVIFYIKNKRKENGSLEQ